MKHKLNFASYNVISENIIEVIVDEGVSLSLEMIDECHNFVQKNMKQEFGLLINTINDFNFTFEAKLSVASHENMRAIAFVHYNEQGKNNIIELQRLRAMDGWNQKNFSGLELGWQKAQQWLTDELKLVTVN